MGTPVSSAHLNGLFQPIEGGPAQGTSGNLNSRHYAPNNPGHSPERVRKEDVDGVHEGSRNVR